MAETSADRTVNVVVMAEELIYVLFGLVTHSTLSDLQLYCICIVRLL